MIRDLWRCGMIAFMIMPLGCADTPRTHLVEVRNFVYMPAQLQIAPGDTVLFVNRDFVPHTATARDSSWDSGEILPGDTARIAVPVETEYFCAYHPNMVGNISLPR